MSKSYQSYPCMGEIVRIVTVAKVSIITSPDVAIIFPNQIEAMEKNVLDPFSKVSMGHQR